MLWIGICIGLVIGANVGLLIFALCNASEDKPKKRNSNIYTADEIRAMDDLPKYEPDKWGD